MIKALLGLSVFFLSVERGESLEMFKESSETFMDYIPEKRLPKCIKKIMFMRY